MRAKHSAIGRKVVNRKADQAQSRTFAARNGPIMRENLAKRLGVQ